MTFELCAGLTTSDHKSVTLNCIDVKERSIFFTNCVKLRTYKVAQFN